METISQVTGWLREGNKYHINWEKTYEDHVLGYFTRKTCLKWRTRRKLYTSYCVIKKTSSKTFVTKAFCKR